MGVFKNKERRMRITEATPQQIRNLMSSASDVVTLRSLAKLYDALVTGDDMLRIEAEDELEGVVLE